MTLPVREAGRFVLISPEARCQWLQELRAFVFAKLFLSQIDVIYLVLLLLIEMIPVLPLANHR